MKPPRPTTLSACLVSSGYGTTKWTWHSYHETKASVIPATRADPALPIWEHLFRCNVTGALRRWGYEKRFDHVERGTPDFPERMEN